MNGFASKSTLLILAYLFSSPAWCVNGPWSMALPTETTAALNAIATSGAVDVAVGANGVVLTSADGTHWTKVTTGYEALADNLVSVAWAGGKFYAVGDHGLVLESTDGVHWAGQFPMPWGLVEHRVSGFSGIAVSNNLIVVTDIDGLYLTTKAGSVWAAGFDASSDFDASRHIVWGPGDFYGISGSTLESSADGITKTTVTSYPGSQLCDIASNGALLVAQDFTGHFYTTTDGVRWSGPGPAAGMSCYVSKGLHWTGHDFVWFNSYAPGSYYISADGLNWAAYTTPAGYSFNDMIWDGAKYIAVGTFGTVLTSPDGAAWTQVSGPSNAAALNSPALNSAVQFIVWNGSQFIATTYGSAMVGSGTSWNTAPLSQELFFLTFVNDKTYAIVGGGLQTLYTTDGINWNTSTLPSQFTSISGDGASQVVAWQGIGTNSQVSISNDDGATWTVQAESGIAPRKLIRAQNQYVGINQYDVLQSTDGINWNSVTLITNGSVAPGSPALDDIVYGNGKYLVLANDGQVFTSPDAARWSKSTLTFVGPTNPVNLDKVVWDGSEFLAIGGTGQPSDPAPYEYNVWVSADGVTWNPEVLPPGMSVNAIGVGGGQVLIGGRNGDLATATPNLRGIPVASSTGVSAAPSTQADLAPQTPGSFRATEPQGLPLTYTVGGGDGAIAGSFVVTIPDQKSGDFVATAIESPTRPSNFQYVVSNDVVYSAPGTISLTVSNAPSGGSGGGSGGSGGSGGKSGGGTFGLLSLLMLVGAGVVKRMRR